MVNFSFIFKIFNFYFFAFISFLDRPILLRLHSVCLSPQHRFLFSLKQFAVHQQSKIEKCKI